MSRQSTAYLFTCPKEDFLPGGFFKGLSLELLEAAEKGRDLRNQNPWINPYGDKFRWTIRKRYRGPRRPTHAGKSICLQRDATHCDVYMYLERC